MNEGGGSFLDFTDMDGESFFGESGGSLTLGNLPGVTEGMGLSNLNKYLAKALHGNAPSLNGFFVNTQIKKGTGYDVNAIAGGNTNNAAIAIPLIQAIRALIAVIPALILRKAITDQHGNRSDNPEKHIVYEIFMTNNVTGKSEILKYGISNWDRWGESRPKSQKPNLQARYGPKGYTVDYRILNRDVHGRLNALLLELKYVDDYVRINYKPNRLPILPPEQYRPIPDIFKILSKPW